VPHRGKRNEPAFVMLTAARLAQEWGKPLEETIAQVRNNTIRVFDLDSARKRPLSSNCFDNDSPQ
jgi:Tat protein secretion system quality control protein TatD with DNase activity